MELKNISPEIRNSMDISKKAYRVERNAWLVNQKKNHYKYPNKSIIKKKKKTSGKNRKKHVDKLKRVCEIINI